MSLLRGTLALVELDPTLGWEQRGIRPCVVVSDAAVNRNQRFPPIAVVPVTGTAATGALYPALAPGPCGFSKPSTALVHQLRPIDKRPIRWHDGQVLPAELAAIAAGLSLHLGLEPEPAP